MKGPQTCRVENVPAQVECLRAELMWVRVGLERLGKRLEGFRGDALVMAFARATAAEVYAIRDGSRGEWM